jgi:hypothetical protein
MRSSRLFLVPLSTALSAVGVGACIESATLDPGTPGECASNELACGAECVRTDIDPANCGDCGIACPADFVCQDGRCAAGCAGGSVECGGGCVDTNTDPQHCGDCNQPCATGDVCVGGTCMVGCPANTEQCGTECIDTTSDEDHCGDCMTDCAPEDQCLNSVCVPLCGPGTTNCDGDCVNTNEDANHCGGCNNVCASGQCGTTLTETFATQASNWNYNVDAAHDPMSQSAVLTPNQMNRVGTVTYKFPIEIDAFTMSFEFRIGNGGGNGGDGMAFVFHQSDPMGVGFGGAGLGVAGGVGYGLELDTFQNPGSCGDPNHNHVAVDVLDVCGAGLPTTIASNANVPINLEDFQWHVVDISVGNGAMAMWLDTTTQLFSNVSLPGFVPGTPYYLTFGAAGGTAYNRHEVRNLSFTVPTVRCM